MKIIAIGDSISEGYPYTQKESWVTNLATQLKCEVINKGINGDLTENLCGRFQDDVLSLNPSHVIILGGTNDAYAKFPLEIVTRNFVNMVEMSHKEGIIPILGLPIPCLLPADEAFLRQYRHWLITYANTKALFLIDFYTPFHKRLKEGEEYEYFVDEFHPNIEGYKLMGEIALNTLVGYLK